jgi:glucose/arabinose dehydrogenase
MRLRDRIATAVLGLALVLAVAATAAAQGFTFVVSSSGTSTVAQFDQAGNFVNLYVPSGAGGLNQPAGFSFGPDGNLYVVPALKVTLKAVEAGDLVNVEVGQQFDSAQAEIRDSTLAVVATYTLSGVKITAVRISGEATTSVLTQEIVTSGKTLAFTTP